MVDSKRRSDVDQDCPPAGCAAESGGRDTTKTSRPDVNEELSNRPATSGEWCQATKKLRHVTAVVESSIWRLHRCVTAQQPRMSVIRGVERCARRCLCTSEMQQSYRTRKL